LLKIEKQWKNQSGSVVSSSSHENRHEGKYPKQHEDSGKLRGAGDMKESNKLIPEDYASLLAEVKERVRAAQYDALKAVNKELVALYWDIGRMVTERQTAGAHGTAVVKRLAADLQAEFPSIVGFSWRNLFNMSEFFTAYRDKPKLQPLAAIIGWTQNLVILQRCKELLEREFYLRMTAKFGWTKNVLIHQIENQSYEKTLLGQTNFDKALTPKL
jgi:predicted nuclease of restriction endonuclease-like (RecB) superfamily